MSEGAPVAWQLPTTLEALVLCGALARLGAVQVPILPILRAREVGFAVRQTGARRLFVPGTFRGFDHAAMARAIASEAPGSPWRSSPGRCPRPIPPACPRARAPRGAADAVRWIFYTSGTTADPKGARHTDATLLAAARGMSARLALAPDDRVGLVFPFTHVGGVLWLMNGLLAGCAHIAISVFDPRTSVDVLARHGVTQAGAGTAFHQAYLAAQRERGGAPIFPRVRAFPGGGAPKPPQLHADVKRELGGAGIVSGYGMTECPVLAMGSPRDPDAKLAHTEGQRLPAAGGDPGRRGRAAREGAAAVSRLSRRLARRAGLRRRRLLPNRRPRAPRRRGLRRRHRPPQGRDHPPRREHQRPRARGPPARASRPCARSR